MQNLIKNTTFLAIIACFLWSTAFVGIKIGLNYNTPLQFAGIRFFIAGIFLLPFIKDINKKCKYCIKRWRIILLISLLQTTFLYALFYLGLNKVPGSLGALLVGSSPLFVAIAAHFFLKNDKMSWYKLFCILLGIAGIGIISIGKGGFSLNNYPEIFIGIGILLLNNICAGLGNVAVAKYGEGLPPIMLSSFSLIIGGALLIIISLPIEGLTIKFDYPLPYYLSLFWLSFLSSAAITIWYTLIQRPGVYVSKLNMWKFIIPVLGACLSWLILPDEHPTCIALIGMGFISASLLLLNYKKAKH